MQLLTLLFAIGVLFSMGNCSCKDSDSDLYSDTCHEILQGLENALIIDKGNLYRLKKVFFYAPNADPVLLRVEYNITFAENITEYVLPYCRINSQDMSNHSKLMKLNQTTIIHGWTSKGLYRWIEPLHLSRIQMTLPFQILRLTCQDQQMALPPWIRRGVMINETPEMKAFLWDGSYNLSSLLINLHITSLPCIPPEEIFRSTVEELTTFVSYRISMKASKNYCSLATG